MKYRDNNYFNDKDFFLVETNLNKSILTKLHFDRGNWYTTEGMQYKATSVKTLNVNEGLTQAVIEYEGYVGRTTSNIVAPSFIGVIWNQGQKNIPHYWVNINEFKFK